MIIISVFGGLGNQMFQYAFGKALSKKLGVEFRIDFFSQIKGNLLKTMINRSFELKNFNLKVYKLNFIESIFFRIFSFKQKFVEKKFFYDSSVFNSKSIWYNGYWQSYKYFDDIKKELLIDFEPKIISKESNQMKKIIFNCNSVSIHVRRKDYLNDIFSNLFESNYYLSAINLVNKKIKKPVFFVFSDDLEWVKKNIDFKKNKVYFIDFNQGTKSFEDMYLMSCCKNNIIANSSFSWWGAYLNKHKNPLIISPKKWFRDKNYSAKDLIPNNWVKL